MKQQLCSEMGGSWDVGTKKCGVPDCQTGEVLTKIPGGLNCVPASSSNVPNCDQGKILGFDSNKNPKCVDDQTGSGGATLPSCANGDMMVHDGSDFKCKKAPVDQKCGVAPNANKPYLQGFKPNGDPICVAADREPSLDVRDWQYQVQQTCAPVTVQNPSFSWVSVGGSNNYTWVGNLCSGSALTPECQRKYVAVTPQQCQVSQYTAAWSRVTSWMRCRCI